MIEKFISEFTQKKIGIVQKIGRKYYLIEKEVADVISKISIKPELAGVFLGEEKKTGFSPSIALLDMLAQMSDKKIYLDEKSAWLFLCGRDVMAKSIIKANVEKGLVLLQNEKDEHLGYGKIIGNVRQKSDRIVVENIMDKGDFLRREMKK